MGKAALLYIAAASLMLTGLYADGARSEMATTQREATYYNRVIAREIAQSAFNVLLSRTRQDFGGHRPDRTAVPYAGGTFAYRAIGDITGPVHLEAIGESGGVRYRMNGMLVQDEEAKYAALTFDGPVENINPRGSSWLISGLDTPPPGDSLAATPLHGPGLRTVLESADAKVRAAMPPRQVVGLHGEGDFEQGEGPVNFARLATEIQRDPDAIHLEGPQRWDGSPTFGSPEEPVMMVVEGDLTITGSPVGYGVLLVKGSFEVLMSGTPRWEGLVIVQTEGGEHGILGNTSFYGAMIMQSVTADGETGGEDDAGIPGGHFDVTIMGAGDPDPLYQAHQYDDRYDVTGIDLLRPGCGIEGGLCWHDVVEGVPSVRIRTINTADVAGTIRLETTTYSISSRVADGLDRTFSPGFLRRLSVDFDGLCSMPRGTPGAVSGDDGSRGGTFTIRVFDASSGAFLMDISTYHHLAGDTCAPRRDGEESPFVDVKPMTLDMRGNPGIHSSSQTLRRLVPMLKNADPGQPRLILRNVWEWGEWLTY